MRTDSVRISEEAQGKALEFIKSTYGEEYSPEKPREYKGKKNIQDAHEAIRPTYVEITQVGQETNEWGTNKLYTLIWNRFMQINGFM